MFNCPSPTPSRKTMILVGRLPLTSANFLTHSANGEKCWIKYLFSLQKSILATWQAVHLTSDQHYLMTTMILGSIATPLHIEISVIIEFSYDGFIHRKYIGSEWEPWCFNHYNQTHVIKGHVKMRLQCRDISLFNTLFYHMIFIKWGFDCEIKRLTIHGHLQSWAEFLVRALEIPPGVPSREGPVQAGHHSDHRSVPLSRIVIRVDSNDHCAPHLWKKHTSLNLQPIRNFNLLDHKNYRWKDC